MTVSLALALSVGIGVGSVQAKEFRPGDLDLCNLRTCVAITNLNVLRLLGGFFYDHAVPPRIVAAAPIGSTTFFLTFKDGYTTGIVAGGRLDRFLSYGVNEDRFVQGRWYRLPGAASSALRRLARGLKPVPLAQSLLDRSI